MNTNKPQEQPEDDSQPTSKGKRLTEMWKDIPGYEGLYQVSSIGRVKSLARVVEQRSSWRVGSFVKRVSERMLLPHIGTAGYPRVTLYLNGRSSYRQIHTLVAETFIGPRPDGMFVCHNDGSRTNNCVDNLRYDTPSGNSADMVAHGTQYCGENHLFTKLSDDDVRKVFEMRASGMTYKDIAVCFSVTKGGIRSLCEGRSRKYLNMPRLPKSAGRDADISESIRCDRQGGMTLAQLTDKYGVPRSTASRICMGVARGC